MPGCGDALALQSLAEARTPPLVPQWIEVSNVIWPELQAAIVGQKTPKEALDEALGGMEGAMPEQFAQLDALLVVLDAKA